MDLAHPEFVPDPDRSREEMEDLQRAVAETAVFADDFEFGPDAFALDGPLSLETVRTDGQSTLADVADAGGADADRGDDADAESADAPVVVGVDQAFLEERAVSAIVAIQDGRVIDRAHAVTPLSIPYVPGLLAFREGGPILEAFEALSVEPDLAVFDGNGRIHFRQAGIATHVGVTLDLPSVGVAKNHLCGTPDEDPDGRSEGWRTPVRADDRVEAPEGTVLGHLYQSRQYESSRSINPIYVSPGHRVSPATAVDLIESLCAGYKLPEPTRLADAYAAEVKAQYD